MRQLWMNELGSHPSHGRRRYAQIDRMAFDGPGQKAAIPGSWWRRGKEIRSDPTVDGRRPNDGSGFGHSVYEEHQPRLTERCIGRLNAAHFQPTIRPIRQTVLERPPTPGPRRWPCVLLVSV